MWRAGRAGFGVPVSARRVVSIWSAACVAIWRAGRAGFGVSVVSRRVASIRSCRVEVKAQTQKKPDSSIGESGSAIARRRALLTFDASRFGVLFVSIRSRRVDSVASCRFGRVASRFGVPVVPVVPIWSAACVAIWRAGRADTEDKTQKKPDSSIGESGSAIARRRALLTFR